MNKNSGETSKSNSHGKFREKMSTSKINLKSLETSNLAVMAIWMQYLGRKRLAFNKLDLQNNVF